MSEEVFQAIRLPEGMIAWARTLGLFELACFASDIALSLEFVLTDASELTKAREPLARLVSVLRESAVLADTPWPVVVLVDLSQVSPARLAAARQACFELANDPTWHKGECCLYVAPLLEVASTDWSGPKTRHELRRVLLNRTVISEVPALERKDARSFVEALSLEESLDASLRENLIASIRDRGEPVLHDLVVRWYLEKMERHSP